MWGFAQKIATHEKRSGSYRKRNSERKEPQRATKLKTTITFDYLICYIDFKVVLCKHEVMSCHEATNT